MLDGHSSFSAVPSSVIEAQNVRQDTAPANRPNLGPSVQAILERARAAEQQTLAASCAHAAVEARRKRAEQAWLRVSTFLGDRIPRDVRGPALWRHYAELIVALGKVLQADGGLTDVMSGTTYVHGAGLLDDPRQATPVHVLHNQ